MRKIVFFCFLLLLLVSFAAANTISLDSNAGLNTTCGAGAVFPCTTTVAITPHPLWQGNNPTNPGNASDTSAVWISYALTGYGDSQFQPFQGTTPVVSVFDNFQSGAGMLRLHVWSDDTADVIVDGINIVPAKFTQSNCSGQPIGCVPGDVGVINMQIGAGKHTLEFVMYQVGTGGDTTSNPFGLLFTGTAPTPEPSSLLLLGGGLVALRRFTRRRIK